MNLSSLNCARRSKSIVAMKCTKLGAAYWRGDVRLASAPPRVQSATGVTGVRFDRRRTTRCSVCMVFRSQTRSAWPNGRCARAVPCALVFCRQLSGRGCGCSCAWKRQKSAITESLGSSRFARAPVYLAAWTPDLVASRGCFRRASSSSTPSRPARVSSCRTAPDCTTRW